METTENKPECEKGPCPMKMGKFGKFGKCKKPKAKVGLPVPDFTAPIWENGNFGEFTLSKYQGKWVVLFFYPMDFTFVCPTEICAFNDASDNFAKINTVVVGASCDSQFVHREWALRERKQGGLAPCKIPLIADHAHEVSKIFGCYIKHGPNAGVTFRATYIIDPKGVLRHMSVNDLMVGRSTDEIMRLVQAFQFTDEHGEVCPSNWKPGKKAMKPKAGDPDLKKYFEEEMGKEGKK